METEIVLR